MALAPSVNGLDDRLGERADMLRVSIHTSIGKTLAERYDFEFTPLFIILDGLGREIWRGNTVPSVGIVPGED